MLSTMRGDGPCPGWRLAVAQPVLTRSGTGLTTGRWEEPPLDILGQNRHEEDTPSNVHCASFCARMGVQRLRSGAKWDQDTDYAGLSPSVSGP